MAKMIDVHCHCKQKREVKSRNSIFSAIASILIVFLPKCSFCMLSYSSAIVLCSGASLTDHTPGWFSWISVGLSLFTLLMLGLNFRDNRTWVAIGLVLIGSSLIAYAELYNGSLSFYYPGASLILFGVWVNGSFYYILYRWIKPSLKRFHFTEKVSHDFHSID